MIIADSKYDCGKNVWFHHEADRDKDYEVSTARIDKPYFGRGGRDDACLGLHMELNGSNGISLFYMGHSPDIEELLLQFGVLDVKELDGKVVECLMADVHRVVGFRVAKHFVKRRRAG